MIIKPISISYSGLQYCSICSLCSISKQSLARSYRVIGQNGNRYDASRRRLIQTRYLSTDTSPEKEPKEPKDTKEPELRPKPRSNRLNSPIPSPKQLKAHLDKYVVGQDKVKRAMCVAVYNHLIRVRDEGAKDDDCVKLEKSNVLVLGPTGSGKTLIARVLADFVDVSCSISDCTSMTQSGYVGDDVDSCVTRLAQEANNELDRIQSGIVILDEFDKLARVSNTGMVRDVSGEGAQYGLLKLVEGTKVNVPLDSPGEKMLVDTSNILFIFLGAFPDLEKIVMRRTSKKTIGFEARQNEQDLKHALDNVLPEDIVQYGIIAELAGRVPIITNTNTLDEAALVRILLEPQNALVKQYQYLYSKWNCRLAITRPAVEEIASIAYTRKIGARGLRSLLDEILCDSNFECPGSGTRYVLINKEAVRNKDKRPNYYSSYQKSAFVNDIRLEDEELAESVNQALFTVKNAKFQSDVKPEVKASA